MELLRVSLSGFRNLAVQAIEVGPGLTAVVGRNGAGKTNLLEAVAVLGNLGSFRPGPASSWIQRGGQGFSLAGVIDRGGEVSIRQDVRGGTTVARALYRGARRLGAAEYLELFPVVTLSGHDRALVWGGPEDRRRFLDRLCFQLHPEALATLQRYRRALRHRNAMLLRGGPAAEFDAFEHDLAARGAEIVRSRLAAMAGLERHLASELQPLGWSTATPVLRYHSSDGVAIAETATLTARLRAALASSRRLERGRGHTAVGPHRHDLQLTVQGVPAREALSAGQGKLLATGLKLAAMAMVAGGRGRRPVVVFDDVDAELDATVLERVLARLRDGGQTLLSSAHEEMIRAHVGGGAVWRVENGVVDVAATGGSV